MDRNAKPPSKWPLGPYGLSIVLALLFLGSWVAQFVTQYQEVSHEAAQHGQSFQWGEFWSAFGKSTFENWQSEFLQLLSFVVLTSYFIHRGSAESKDSDEEIHAALERIEARLVDMENAVGGNGHAGAGADGESEQPEGERSKETAGRPG